MSTKATIRSGQNWSLYEDRADGGGEGYVYLRIESADVRVIVRLTETQAREMGLVK
jgi:hypothetical protein